MCTHENADIVFKMYGLSGLETEITVLKEEPLKSGGVINSEWLAKGMIRKLRKRFTTQATRGQGRPCLPRHRRVTWRSCLLRAGVFFFSFFRSIESYSCFPSRAWTSLSLLQVSGQRGICRPCNNKKGHSRSEPIFDSSACSPLSSGQISALSDARPRE